MSLKKDYRGANKVRYSKLALHCIMLTDSAWLQVNPPEGMTCDHEDKVISFSLMKTLGQVRFHCLTIQCVCFFIFLFIYFFLCRERGSFSFSNLYSIDYTWAWFLFNKHSPACLQLQNQYDNVGFLVYGLVVCFIIVCGNGYAILLIRLLRGQKRQ